MWKEVGLLIQNTLLQLVMKWETDFSNVQQTVLKD